MGVCYEPRDSRSEPDYNNGLKNQNGLNKQVKGWYSMGFFNDYSGGDRAIPMQQSVVTDINPILRWVYAWMTLGVIVSFAVGMMISSVESVAAAVIGSPLLFVVLIGQVVLVLALSFGIRRMSPGLAAGMFLVYSATIGVTIAIVFLTVELNAIFAALSSTVVLFGSMTAFGFLTKADLTRLGNILIVGLIALIGVMILNFFMQSDGLQFLISIAGVVIFTGLTAYDTQRIKLMAQDPTLQADQNMAFKLSIMGALTLYLDFINLFLFLVRLFAARD